MKVGDKVEVINSVYEGFSVGYQGLITSSCYGWDDEGNVAIIFYLDNKGRNPFLAFELEVLS